MDASALDLGAVALRGRVVDADPQPLALEQRPNQVKDDGDGQVIALSANGADGDVALPPVVGDAGSPEPGSDGTAAPGEEDAGKQHGQPRRRAFVQPVAQGCKDAGHQGW